MRRSSALAALLLVAVVTTGMVTFLGLPSADDRAEVTLADANGTELATVDAEVADDPTERYRGLSGHESLANGTGMLFVFDDEGERAFVMRDMAFALDMVFVAANGTITEIHEAPVPADEDDELTRYRGQAKWVLEVPRGYTAANDVEEGDRVIVDR